MRMEIENDRLALRPWTAADARWLNKYGHGYATEAARAVVAAAADTGRSRLWSTVGVWNVPSLRVLEKLGFERDHTTEEANGPVVWLTLRLGPASRR
jgi:RimJ/RimL family protein N-acetyltransferase